MLRVHFSATDLARLRLRETVGPLAETLLALRVIRSPNETAMLGEWRRAVLSRLPRSVIAPASRRAPVDSMSVLIGASVERGLAAVRGLGADEHRLAALL